jgi:hypothetical protein
MASWRAAKKAVARKYAAVSYNGLAALMA